MPVPLYLLNTLSRKKELFVPRVSNKVSLYVCGITPYDYTHIGHGRTYINFDVLVRMLKFLGYQVTYVRNVTDIDDKLLNKAIAQGDINQYLSIADFFTKDYQQQMKALHCLPPTLEPKATESINAIIDLIDRLLKKDIAYVSGHDVYFDVTKAADYGKLSGKNLDDMIAGARVEVSAIKKHPGDFVLWKGNDTGEFWSAPWGYGRPGWHIECSAMVHQHLGSSIDIHCGGLDLIFPHHENEIAQSESGYDAPLARYWLHNEFLNLNKEKMSKSLGNILGLKEVLSQHDPMNFRFYILQHHYRTPIEFTTESLVAAETARVRLVKAFQDALHVSVDATSVAEAAEESGVIRDILAALADDLNTPKALGIMFEHLADIKASKELAALVRFIFEEIMGIDPSISTQEVSLTPEIEKLIALREEARRNKEWSRADELRDQLIAHGYVPQDKKL